MSELGVDGNFKRLEDEVNRLLELLEQLRVENQGLKQQVAQLESTESDLNNARIRLTQMEGELQQSQQSRDEVRTRLERLIGVIEQASPAPGTAA